MVRQHIRDISVYFIIALAGLSINLASRLVYDLFVGFMVSIAFSYFTGMIVAFTLTKMFLFDAKASGNTKKEFIRFFVVTCIALSITMFFSWVAISILNQGVLGELHEERSMVGSYLGKAPTLETVNETLAHLVGVGFGFFGNYFGHRYYSFKALPT